MTDLRRPEQPLHARLWGAMRANCSWSPTRWRQDPKPECRYPFCSCPVAIRFERAAEENHK